MIVEFSVKNYRSIREKQTFSLVAEATKNKRESNTFQVEIGKKDNIQLLKSAVVFGANGSGKSNFLKSFKNFRDVIVSSGKLSGSALIKDFDPFLFGSDSQTKDTEYECIFIIRNVKYFYLLSYNLHRVTKEELYFYPKNSKKALFKRVIGSNERTDSVKIAKDVNEIDTRVFPELFTVFKNQAVLSKFGADIAEPFFHGIFSYFERWRMWTDTSQGFSFLINHLTQTNDNWDVKLFFKKVENLIRAVDTKINGLLIAEKKKEEVNYINHPNHPNNLKEGNPDQEESKGRDLYSLHSIYDDNKNEVGIYQLPFNEESAGTNITFALGAYILAVIEVGGVIIFDELDNSLHPLLARFLVSMFNNSTINKKNAQIIFTTHEASLIDKDMFRSDQIWFASKNDRGETEIYSAQDFDGIREDIPFDKWYLAGKFGAIPDIKDLEYIFSNGNETK